jgi:hypothetical protein
MNAPQKQLKQFSFMQDGTMKKVLMMCGVIGFAAVGQAGVVDSFDSYSTGNLGNVANPPWTSVGNPTSGNVLIGQETGGNKYFSYFDPNTSVVRGGTRAITAVPTTSTAETFFLRFYTETASQNNTFGLSTLAAPAGFGDFSVMMRVTNSFFDVRDGAAMSATQVPILASTWYNVWAVVNQTTEKFDVYLTSGSADATSADKVFSNAGFRNLTVAPLVSFAALVQGYTAAPTANKVRLDDLYQFDGTVLTNPVPEPATMTMMNLGLGGLFLRTRKY